jgi:hypothetical protein
VALSTNVWLNQPPFSHELNVTSPLSKRHLMAI